LVSGKTLVPARWPGTTSTERRVESARAACAPAPPWRPPRPCAAIVVNGVTASSVMIAAA
jgi:hypothetical protein